jgi:uncharacterized membrane protein YbhN (UPF0104 family)
MHANPPTSLWARGLKVTVSVGLLGFVLSRVDLGQAGRALMQAPRWVFFVPATCLLVNSGIQAWRVRLLFGAHGIDASVFFLFRVFVVGSFWGLVLPMGGAEAARLALLHRRLGAFDSCASTLFVARLLETLPWGGLLVWGLVSGLLDGVPLLAGAAWLGLALFAGAWCVCIGVWWTGPSVAQRLPSMLAAPVTRAAQAIDRFRGNPWRLVFCALLGVPFTLVNAGVVWAVFVAYGVPLDYPAVLGVVPAADVWISLPVSMAGIGVRESVFVVALAPFGVEESVALAVIFTRWTGELGRAAAGGLFLATD